MPKCTGAACAPQGVAVHKLFLCQDRVNEFYLAAPKIVAGITGRF